MKLPKQYLAITYIHIPKQTKRNSYSSIQVIFLGALRILIIQKLMIFINMITIKMQRLSKFNPIVSSLD